MSKNTGNKETKNNKKLKQMQKCWQRELGIWVGLKYEKK